MFLVILGYYEVLNTEENFSRHTRIDTICYGSICNIANSFKLLLFLLRSTAGHQDTGYHNKK